MNLLSTQQQSSKPMEETEATVLTETALAFASACMMVETVAAVAQAVQSIYERTVLQTSPSQLLQQSLLSQEALVKRVRHTGLEPLGPQVTLVQPEVPTQVHGQVGPQITQLVEAEIHHHQPPLVSEMVHLLRV
jgi:hypothetical protein